MMKRIRSISPTPSTSSSSTSLPPSSPPPPVKVIRSNKVEEYSCSLVPHCDLSLTYYKTLEALQNHQLTCHTFICRQNSQVDTSSVKGKGKTLEEGSECGKVFPDDRLLELHTKECHDPSFQSKVDQGLRMFECLLPTSLCSSTFSSPKSRRLHMLSKHKFPNEYFFGITLWGINDIMRKGSVGGALIRQEYKGSKVPGGGSSTTKSRELPPHIDLDELLPETDQSASDSVMDDLTNSFAETKIKLGLVPRAVRLAKKKEKGREVEMVE